MLTGNLAAILAAIGALLVLGLYAGLRGRSGAELTCFGTVTASAVIAAHALMQLIQADAEPLALDLPLGLPWLNAQLRLDPLASWFLLVVNLVGATAAIYTLTYVRHVDEPRRMLPLLPAYLATMNLVLLAGDAFSFLLSWEAMSLVSWLLVLSNHREPGNARAAMIYLVMAGVGTGCLILAFGIMAGFEGAYSFEQIRGAPPTGVLGSVALALVLLGAGSKAGLVPLHAWLPLAHPAAPSPVSALMSGVMTKVAVYGLVRVFFDLSGDVSWGWGAIVLALGAVSAVLGVLYALMEHDLKVLLAYHTVENIGIIVIGLGLALVFRSNGLHALASLAMIAALLHVLNHALFKSLLFFGAGAVLIATGERDMEKQGGLIHRMPRTAFLFLVGSAAISALPPFNGFVSEWLTFQAILSSPNLPQWALKFGVPVVGAALALAAALAAACFVKAFGVTFLGRPRTPAAANAKEVDIEMIAAMAVLAALCVAIGLVPQGAIAMLAHVTDDLIGDPNAAAAVAANGGGLAQWLFLSPLGAGRSSYSGLIVLAVVALVTTVVVLGVHSFASNRVRRGPAWDCGYPDASAATQYTASSFAQPIRRLYGTFVFRALEKVDMPEPGESRAARLEVRMIDPAWVAFYAPVERFVTWLADRLNVLQFLTIRRYLVLMFTTLIVLLSVVAVLAT
jgi:hydrogenase-4 component B